MNTFAELLHADLPSGRVVVALAPLLVAVLAFVVYCLVDLVRAPHVLRLPKVVWALIIVAFSPPFGAIGYLVFGKDRYDRQPPPVGDQRINADA